MTEEEQNLTLLPTLMLKSPMMRDSAVKSLQIRLNNLMPSLKLAEDGIYGTETAEGVRTFQKSEKLRVDGVVGPIVWRRLMEK